MARNSLRARIEVLEKRRGFGLPTPRTIVVRFVRSDGLGGPAGYVDKGYVVNSPNGAREVSLDENGELVNDPFGGGEK